MTKTIRLTEDCMNWAKKGTEHEVHVSPLVQFFDEYIQVPTSKGHRNLYLYEMEGFYEVVRYKPNPGQFYFFVSDTGASVKDRYTAPFERHDRLIESGNCEETREKSTSKAEQIRAIYEEGV